MARFDTLDYTDRDYDAIMAFIKGRIKALFPDWTDHELTNVGIIIAETVAYVGDKLNYYQDRQINEAFLVSAKERQNVIDHLSHIGYGLRTAQPAKSYQLYTLDKVYPEDVLIAAGDQIKTFDGNINFETQSDLTIDAGVVYGSLAAAIALANDVKLQYEAHRVLTTDGIHGVADSTNAVSATNATDFASLITLVNELRADYEAHRVLTAGGVHNAADIVNAISKPAATTLQQAIDLINDISDKYEAHRIEDATVHGQKDVYNEVTVIKAGYVLAVQGSTQGPEIVGVSNGDPLQAFKMSKAPYISDSESVTINGITWTHVDNLLTSIGSDLHYTVTVDSDDFGTIHFGDGVNGSIPVNGASIIVTYRTGGGAFGIVDANRITKSNRSYTTVGGIPVRMAITNPSKSFGGIDRETIRSGKLRGPLSFKTNNRSIAKEDFEIHSTEVAGVARALPQTVNDDLAIEENTVNIYLVATAGSVVTLALRQQVRSYLTTVKPKTLTQRLNVFTAPRITVDIAGTVYLKPGFNANTIQSQIQAILAVYFDPENIEDLDGKYTINFGEKIGLSKLHDIMHVPGVSRIVLTQPLGDIVPDSKELPQLGTVILTMTPET